ncbi:MAG: hypothetical protein JWO25_2536, partial [Alphaproteobacteria bacterium]|nr:hypothetical protein [Alphaproteobacteria bacterium]
MSASACQAWCRAHALILLAFRSTSIILPCGDRGLMMNLLLRPWRRLVDFRGRSTRREFGLLHVQFFAVLFLLSALTGVGDDTDEVSVRA